MKKVHFILIFLFCFQLTDTYAQSFWISNSEKTKFIYNTDLIELKLGTLNGKKDKSCDCTNLIGHIKSVSKDSILIKTEKLRFVNDFSKSDQLLNYSWNDTDSVLYIAKKDIVYIKNLNSNKIKKRKRNLSNVGSILTSAGILTAINTFLTPLPGKKRNLFFVSIGEFLIGII